MKSFIEALNDGFVHITELTDSKHIEQLRSDGVLVDTDGYWVFSFGEHKEFELCIEPLAENRYYVSLYKNRVLITEKLPVCTREDENK